MSAARPAGVAIGVSAILGIGIGLSAALTTSDAQEESTPQRTERSTSERMHGQASWAAGERRAPPFTLRDHDGRTVSLPMLRGRPVLLTFFDSHCDEQCPVEGRMLGQMLEQMPSGERPTLVIVSVNPRGDTPASIRHAMAEWRLTGPWEWHWLRGTRPALRRVWDEYGITVHPTTNDITHGMALYLIDRQGFERAGYLFPFLPNFVQLDLQHLAREQG